MDSTALDALIEGEQSLLRAGCTLILAHVKQDILEALGRIGPDGVSLQSRSISACPMLLIGRGKRHQAERDYRAAFVRDRGVSTLTLKKRARPEVWRGSLRATSVRHRALVQVSPQYRSAAGEAMYAIAD